MFVMSELGRPDSLPYLPNRSRPCGLMGEGERNSDVAATRREQIAGVRRRNGNNRLRIPHVRTARAGAPNVAVPPCPGLQPVGLSRAFCAQTVQPKYGELQRDRTTCQRSNG